MAGVNSLNESKNNNSIFLAIQHVFPFPFYDPARRKVHDKTSNYEIECNGNIWVLKNTSRKNIFFNFLGLYRKRDEDAIDIILRYFRYPRAIVLAFYNTLRLLTEFLPFLFLIYSTKLLASIVQNFKDNKAWLSLLIVAIPAYVIFKLAYYAGRLITSPIQSLRAAWFSGRDIQGKIVGVLLVLFTLVAISALLTFVFPIGASLLLGYLGSFMSMISPAAGGFITSIPTIIMHSEIVAKIGSGIMSGLHITGSAALEAMIGSSVLKGIVFSTLGALNYAFGPIGRTRFKNWLLADKQKQKNAKLPENNPSIIKREVNYIENNREKFTPLPTGNANVNRPHTDLKTSEQKGLQRSDKAEKGSSLETYFFPFFQESEGDGSEFSKTLNVPVASNSISIATNKTQERTTTYAEITLSISAPNNRPKLSPSLVDLKKFPRSAPGRLASNETTIVKIQSNAVDTFLSHMNAVRFRLELSKTQNTLSTPSPNSEKFQRTVGFDQPQDSKASEVDGMEVIL